MWADLFDQVVLRAFYKTEVVDFHSGTNRLRARRMGKASLRRLLVGRVAGPNHCKSKFVRELQDGIDELAKMDEMAFVKIHSVDFGPVRDRVL
jgi:hypothetical protein